jgi:hypothetical protein
MKFTSASIIKTIGAALLIAASSFTSVHAESFHLRLVEAQTSLHVLLAMPWVVSWVNRSSSKIKRVVAALLVRLK